MRPKIKDQLAWNQAELLMQPALIRVLDNIRKKLENSCWTGTYHTIQIPYPGYRLDLEWDSQTIGIDIWELCYHVCFKDYEQAHGSVESRDVEIDTHLFNEMGEVDWSRLEEKTQRIINHLFENLPREPSASPQGSEP